MFRSFVKTLTLIILITLFSGCGPARTTTPVSPTIPPVEGTAAPVSPADTPAPPMATSAATSLAQDDAGGKIAFYSDRDGNTEIYIMDVDGGNLERLTNNSIDDMAPAISPDGTRIAFMSTRDGNREIYVMNIDGTDQQRLTDAPAYESHPAWSPDGTQIAFVSERDGNREIYIMAVDGSNLRRLTDDPAEDMRPNWSPDGTRIAFSRMQDDNWDLYVVDADDNNLQRLTESEFTEFSPAWSPDGSQIAYMYSAQRGSVEIRLMDADGSNDRPLPGLGSINENPIWSPDGTRIVFQSNRDGNWEIYVMDADGSNQQRLTNDAAGDYWPSWGPFVVEAPSQLPTTAPTDQLAQLQTPVGLPMSEGAGSLRITIIYDNYLHDERLASEWGFAALVEYADHVLLFDTGGSATLVHNMHLLGIDPKSIEAVVLSHAHMDHIEGIFSFLAEADQPTVYLLASFPADFRNSVSALTDVVEVSHAMEIYPDIYTTGEVTGGVREQALAIRMDGGSLIITGCAHPGIARMVEQGRSALQPGTDVEYMPVALVVGGFHLTGESADQVERVIADLQLLNVQRVAPTHCTGDVAIAMFAEAFGDRFIPGGAGKVIALPTATTAPPLPAMSPPCLVPAQCDQGMVTGQVVLPLEDVSTTNGLALDLFFENLTTQEVSVLPLPEGQVTYSMTLPVGSYLVYVWTPFLAEKGAYTTCQPGGACEDHHLQTITVTAETTLTGVDITDWLPVEHPSLVLAGTLIDGSGADPLLDAALVIRDERIVAVGRRSAVQVPVDARIIDWPGLTLLPGFINTHAHNTYSPHHRQTWAWAGVTTLRDVGAPAYLSNPFLRRDQLNADPENARAIMAGPLVTVPEGYPTRQFSSMTVTSPEDARQKIEQLIDDGAEVIKITMASHAGPTLSLEMATAIVETAHARGIPVTVHVTRLSDLIKALDAGVDDIAHMIDAPAPDAVIQRMVEAGVSWVPTLEPFEGRDSGNLRRFIDAGGVVAMGNDAGYIDGLVIGMPMPEIEYMHAAGMTPMEIIVASTRNGAYVCGRLSTLGTLEVGKYADVLVVEGDPLQDLQVLENVRLVVHSGVIIRQEE